MPRNTSTFGQLAPGAPLVDSDIFAIQRIDGLNHKITGAELAVFIGAMAIPLTIKGDVLGFDTEPKRIPVGSNGQVLTANSAVALGVEWAAGGGGGQTLLRVIKKVDETVNNSTAFQDDDELFFPVEANKIYFILFNLQFSSPLSVNIKYLFTVPTGTTMLSNDYRWDNSNFTLDDATIEDLVITNPSIRGGIFWARIETSSTAGIIQLQWAQQIATVTDTTMKRGATIIVWEELP